MCEKVRRARWRNVESGSIYPRNPRNGRGLRLASCYVRTVCLGCAMLHNRHYVAPIKPNHLARLRFPEIVIYPDKMSESVACQKRC